MLSFFISEVLKDDNVQIDICHTANKAYKAFEKNNYQIVMLDLTLPDEDGLVILRKLEPLSSANFIIISKRADEATRIAALELGAADYLIKPFSPKELQLRLRRYLQPVINNNLIKLDSFSIDLGKRIVSDVNNNLIKLSASEFNILTTLVAAKGNVVSQFKLLDVISIRNEETSHGSLMVLIHRLRKKLPSKDELIITVANVGYRINQDKLAQSE